MKDKQIQTKILGKVFKLNSSVIKFKPMLITLAIFASMVAKAQNIQGFAIYKSQTKVDLNMPDSKMDDAIKKSLAEQLQKQMQKDFTLKFNQKESIFTENQKLAQPNVKPSKGITITVQQSQGELYKNLAKRRYTNQDELFGKRFLIKDSLKTSKWNLGKETKKIGNYTCYKATVTKKFTSEEWSSENDSLIKTKGERIVTAWYTPQIPISNGPAEYWGLPGLILEVQNGKTTLLCSSITLNPTEKIVIEEPKKGKKVNQIEFDKIQKERMDEMRARSDNGKGLFITKTGG